MSRVDIERLAGRRRRVFDSVKQLKVTVSVYLAFAAARNIELYFLEVRARGLFKCEVLNVCQLLFK